MGEKNTSGDRVFFTVLQKSPSWILPLLISNAGLIYQICGISTNKGLTKIELFYVMKSWKNLQESETLVGTSVHCSAGSENNRDVATFASNLYLKRSNGSNILVAGLNPNTD